MYFINKEMQDLGAFEQYQGSLFMTVVITRIITRFIIADENQMSNKTDT